MAGEALYVGVDVAKSTLDVAVTDSGEVRQFTNES
jgi:transposase